MSGKSTCNDCYFRREGLCALPGNAVCPTFRAVTAGGRILPPRQPRLVMRQVAPIASTGLAATQAA
jgi:hypothetical protein